MSKTVLGRTLGALLGETKMRDPATTRTTLEAANAETIGPGLRRLLTGVEAERVLRRTDEGPTEQRGYWDGFASIPAWYLFGADLALLFLASILLWPAVVAPGTGKMVLAGIAVLSGALLSIVPFVRPALEGLPKKEQGRWIVTRHGVGEAERVLMVYPHHPVFIGEVQRSSGGRITVLPALMEGSPPLSPTECQRFAEEAADTYREMIEHRGKQFRASLR